MVLKIPMPHMEAEDEIKGLQFWARTNGNPWAGPWRDEPAPRLPQPAFDVAYPMTRGLVVRDGLAYVNDMRNGRWIIRTKPREEPILF